MINDFEDQHFEDGGTEILKAPSFILSAAAKHVASKSADDDSEDNEGSEEEDDENSGENGKSAEEIKAAKENAKAKEKEAAEKGKKTKSGILDNLFAKKAEEQNEDGNDNEGDDKDKGSTETSVVEDLIKDWGLDSDQIKNEFFKDFDFKDDSIDNIKKLSEIKEYFVGQAVLEEVAEKFPQVASLLDHLSSGKPFESWNQKIQAKDYSKITIDKENVDQQKGIIRELLTKQGVKDTIIDATLESLKDSDKLLTESTDALTTLDKLEKQRVLQIDAEDKKLLDKQKLEDIKIQNEVITLIKTGKVSGITIPDVEKRNFADFALTDKRLEKYEGLTTEQKIFIDYLMFKDFKVKGLDINESPLQQRKIVKKATDGRKTITNTSGDVDIPSVRAADLKGKINLNKFLVQDNF